MRQRGWQAYSGSGRHIEQLVGLEEVVGINGGHWRKWWRLVKVVDKHRVVLVKRE